MKHTLALIFGIAGAIIIGSIFMEIGNEETEEVVSQINEVKAFQIGSFENLENAQIESNKHDSIIIKEGNNYNVYISILEDKELLERMVNHLNRNNIYFYLKTITPSPYFQEELYKYEIMMKETTSDIAFFKLNKKILEVYGENYEN